MHLNSDENGMIIEDLIDARILVELHNRLSFAEAAKALGIPPATVSRRIMRMEDRAGLRLFDRTTRSVCPTEAGSLAVNHAQRMISEVEAVETSLSSMRDAPVGTIRITTPTIFGQALLSPIVSKFLAQFPACDLHIDLADGHINLAEEGYDAAIRVGPIVDDTLVARNLGTVRAGLYRRSGAPDLDLKDLSDLPVALLHRGMKPEPTLQLRSADGESRSFAVKPRLICMNPWLLLEAALASDVIVVLPELIAAPALRTNQLSRVAPDWFARHVPVHLVYQPQRLMRPAVRAFVDLAADQIPKLIESVEID
ncbi:HTH-type transcriptional regulator DmlR [Labrenzia sp. THAF82]|uniref:LysR family transcriptional regulator n=1 Tax=Labrenzia sp. THAF82 TaxID=2587861 RepID=UPI00126922E7|nr:LysR family transcriptional regulator [Labrenzia sp. THAF82]QFT31995.1 HTH-type transcriptional regulator DmlR [Labrenzia sp. THAF82]